jgi:hypothetical protein
MKTIRIFSLMLAVSGAAILPIDSSHAEDFGGRGGVAWEEIEHLVAQGAVKESALLSHDTSDPYKDLPEEGAVLVGFEFIMTPFRKSPRTVRGIRAIFLTKHGEIKGAQHGAEKGKPTDVNVLARPGYAVGKVTGQFDGVAMRRMRIHFERIDGLKLDDRDAYDSPWFGIYDRSLVKEATIETGDHVPVGIAGRSGWGLDGFKLLFAEQ